MQVWRSFPKMMNPDLQFKTKQLHHWRDWRWIDWTREHKIQRIRTTNLVQIDGLVSWLEGDKRMKGSWNIKINLVKFHIEGLFGTQPQSATLNLWQTLGAQNRRHNCGKRMCRKGTIVSCGCLSYLVNQTAQYFCGSATESGVTKFGCKPNTPRLTN